LEVKHYVFNKLMIQEIDSGSNMMLEKLLMEHWVELLIQVQVFLIYLKYS